MTNAHTIGPRSRPHRLRKLDGRSREAKYLRRIERELIDDLGGPEHVSAAKRLLVERVAIDLMRLELLDARMAAETVTVHDARVAHALRNSVRLTLRALGLESAAPRAPTLAELSAGREGALSPAEAYRQLIHGQITQAHR
jgi:hypothetical protein